MTTTAEELRALLPRKRRAAKEKRDDLIMEFCFGARGLDDLAGNIAVLAGSPNPLEKKNFEHMKNWAYHFRYRYTYINRFLEAFVRDTNATLEKIELFRSLDFNRDKYWFDLQHLLFTDFYGGGKLFEIGNYCRNDAITDAEQRPVIPFSLHMKAMGRRTTEDGNIQYGVTVNASYPCNISIQTALGITFDDVPFPSSNDIDCHSVSKEFNSAFAGPILFSAEADVFNSQKYVIGIELPKIIGLDPVIDYAYSSLPILNNGG